MQLLSRLRRPLPASVRNGGARLRRVAVLAVVLGGSACAQLHHVQVGDIDGSAQRVPFDIMVSDTGFSLSEATQVAQAGARLAGASRSSVKQLGTMGDIAALFQMGPVTGNHVFSDDYADGVLAAVQRACPSGAVSGLLVVRESRKYPVVSGEIIRVRGNCLTAPR